MKIPANGFTHAGKFHADDVFATALLQILRPDIKITRGFVVPDDFDGIVYDIGFGMFDHHQEPREYRANGVPYAAFGLLWRVLGPGLVGERQARLIDENFIQPLDLNDNTGEQNSLCDAIGFFNPVWDSKEDKDACFYAHPLPQEGLRELLPWLEKTDIAVSFVEADTAYMNRTNALCENFLKEIPQETIDPAQRCFTYPTYQLSAFLSSEQEPEFMAHVPGCRAVRWSEEFVDILPATGGKVNGLQETLNHLGLTRENSIAFGDGGNDTEMLAFAGIGVAMGNAWPDARAAADYITTDVDKDGIWNALEHFGLLNNQ